jgi:MFS family permease
MAVPLTTFCHARYPASAHRDPGCSDADRERRCACRPARPWGRIWSAGALIVTRALQGLGGALLVLAALSIIVTTFREVRDRNGRSA